MTASVTVAALRDRARRLFEREARTWAVLGAESATLDAPLHPPTERAALADLDAARAWVASWQQAGHSWPIEISWAVRNWPRVGSQNVPERAVVRGAESIARLAGAQREWAVLTERLGVLGTMTGVRDDAPATLRFHARAVAALNDADFDRLIGVLAWLRNNPASGHRIRELPIRGIHTKWIEARRGLVEGLHRAITGAPGLGLREPQPLMRMRVLDPALALGSLTDISAPVSDLAALPLHPERVFVFENLATVLAMPNVPGAIVLDGGGHRVELVARLPWAQDVTYWGDLDSHGFGILHRLRSHGVRATSALMDTETLHEHRDLWVADPEPNVAVFGLLTAEEQRALRLLSAAGNVRLEQERIPWDYALQRLALTTPDKNDQCH